MTHIFSKKSLLAFLLGVALIFGMFSVGINALQQSMSLKMRLAVNPVIICTIQMQKNGTGDWVMIYDNYSATESLPASVGRSALINGVYTYSGSFFTSLTNNDVLSVKITNQTTSAGNALFADATSETSNASVLCSPTYGAQNIAKGASKTFTINPQVAFMNTNLVISLNLWLATATTDYTVSTTGSSGVTFENPQTSAILNGVYQNVIVPTDNSKYPVITSIKNGGVNLSPITDYTFDTRTGELVIKANKVTGNIIIVATSKATVLTGTFTNTANNTEMIVYTSNSDIDAIYSNSQTFVIDSSKDLLISLRSDTVAASGHSYTVTLTNSGGSAITITTTQKTGAANLQTKIVKIPQTSLYANFTITVTVS